MENVKTAVRLRVRTSIKAGPPPPTGTGNYVDKPIVRVGKAG